MKEMEMNIAEKVALLRTAEQRVADEKSIVIEIEKSYGDRLNSLEQANRELEGKLRAAEKRQLEDKVWIAMKRRRPSIHTDPYRLHGKTT